MSFTLGQPAPVRNDEEPVTGNLLGLYRTVRELERLVDLVRECPADLPTLALVDGTLVLVGLGRAELPALHPAGHHPRRAAAGRWRSSVNSPGNAGSPWPPTSPCPGSPRWPTPSGAASVPTNWPTAGSPAAIAAPSGLAVQQLHRLYGPGAIRGAVEAGTTVSASTAPIPRCPGKTTGNGSRSVFTT